jgi:hypothetical protein
MFQFVLGYRPWPHLHPRTLGGGALGRISIARRSPSTAGRMSSLDMAPTVASRVPPMVLDRRLQPFGHHPGRRLDVNSVVRVCMPPGGAGAHHPESWEVTGPVEQVNLKKRQFGMRKRDQHEGGVGHHSPPEPPPVANGAANPHKRSPHGVGRHGHNQGLGTDQPPDPHPIVAVARFERSCCGTAPPNQFHPRPYAPSSARISPGRAALVLSLAGLPAYMPKTQQCHGIPSHLGFRLTIS